MNDILLKKLNAVYQHVMQSEECSLYQTLYSGSTALDVKTIDDWQALPLLTRSLLQETPLLERLFVPYSSIPYLKGTSGTGGRGVLIVPRTDKSTSGTVEAKKCVLQFAPAPISKRASSVVHADINTIDGDLGDLEGSVILAARAGIDSLSGLLFAIEMCIPVLEKHGLTQQISALQITGERPTAQQIHRFRKIFPNALIRIFYIATEVGGLMGVADITDAHELPAYLPYESEYCEFYWEIIDEEGRVCSEDGEEGEAVVTQLWYKGNPFPVLRYKTGDRFQIHKIDNEIRYLSLGRMELDRIKVPGGILQLTEVNRALIDLHPTLSDDFELHYYRPSDENALYKISIHIRSNIERQLTDALVSELAGKLAKRIRIAPHFTISDAISQKVFQPLELVLVQSFDGEGKKRIRFYEH